MRKAPVNRVAEPTIPSSIANFLVALALSAAGVWCVVNQGFAYWGTWLTILLAALAWFVAVGTVIQYRRNQEEKQKEAQREKEEQEGRS